MATGTAFWRQAGDTIVLEVRVQPRAHRDEVVGPRAGRLVIRVGAPPVEGAANERLTKMIAKAFGVPRSGVRLLAGAESRDKRVAVDAPARRPEWLR